MIHFGPSWKTMKARNELGPFCSENKEKKKNRQKERGNEAQDFSPFASVTLVCELRDWLLLSKEAKHNLGFEINNPLLILWAVSTYWQV